jgi:hypothetical protein
VLQNLKQLSSHPLTDNPEKEEVATRTSICKACPFNREIEGNTSLEVAIHHRSYLLTRGKLANLGYCAHHYWDNRVAVVWDRKLLLPVANPVSEEVCWLKK